MPLTKRWLVQPSITPQAAENLVAFPPVLRQVLFNRGYATDAEARAYLRAAPGFDTTPFRLSGMQAAVERIRRAVERGETIAVYGDYDVDGVTATALLVESLRSLGAQADAYIPNRFDEGYGLNNEALDALHERGIKLVISVDCGIRSPEEARHARTLGLDLVISDHHHPGDELPEALAVINPKQPGDAYPDKDLAGVGIAYKIAQALTDGGRSTVDGPPSHLPELLDLVALGTVADLAPLTGENRSLVRTGLRQIRETRRQGLFSLANVASLPIVRTTATDIGFLLGPRLNASGRLESALASYELLTTTDVFRAGQLAQQLDTQNRQRQALTRQIQKQAEALALEADPDALLLFAVHPEFNPGVVGLAASRLVETHYRPAIVGERGEAFTRCSCRSIPEFHITQALDRCADLLVRHGGHAAAAGFTVRNEHVDELVQRLKSLADDALGGQDLRPTLVADAEVPLSELSFDLHKQLGWLEPTGYGNREPLFVSRDVPVKSFRPVGSDGSHLKMTLGDGRATLDAIGFRLGHLAASLPPRVDVVYSFETNEYNGRVSLQLNLKDIRPVGTGE